MSISVLLQRGKVTIQHKEHENLNPSTDFYLV